MFLVKPQVVQLQTIESEEVQSQFEEPQNPHTDKKKKDYPAIIGIVIIAVYVVYIACYVIMRPTESSPLIMMKDIYIAEVQYQGAGYRDKDTDCVGEYGLISELIPYQKYASNYSLLTELKTEDANGYYKNGTWRYAVYVPATDASKVINIRSDDVPLDEYTITHNTQERDFFIVAQNINDSNYFIADRTGHVRSGSGNINEELLKILKLPSDKRGQGAMEKKLISLRY